jgi:indole-3-glycerol phosphate synthase
MDILEEIVACKRIEVAQMKKDVPEKELHYHAERLMRDQTSRPASMAQALRDSDTGIIAEFKRRSPSKGWIKADGSADIIPLSYQTNGATALSILADEKYFGGKPEYIKTARQSGVTIPILYKEFVIDEYQLFQARICGASAVLLIAADLTKDECRSLISTAHTLQLEVLLEMHGKSETEYADMQPDICGINNRNLGTFITDVDNSLRLAEYLPADAVKVSESGICNPDTVKKLHKAGFNGFLIGENFMKAANPGAALREFILELGPTPSSRLKIK